MTFKPSLSAAADFRGYACFIITHPDLDLISQIPGTDLHDGLKPVGSVALALGSGVEPVVEEIQEHAYVLRHDLDWRELAFEVKQERPKEPFSFSAVARVRGDRSAKGGREQGRRRPWRGSRAVRSFAIPWG